MLTVQRYSGLYTRVESVRDMPRWTVQANEFRSLRALQTLALLLWWNSDAM